ncbi:MAG: hypothetical protein HC860_15520, partial [Alkalinema sp. RU_4_3]|nr:hypothetical protein [Alkalinema sp. RU_4_3]
YASPKPPYAQPNSPNPYPSSNGQQNHEKDLIQRSIDSSPLVLHSQPIAQRIPNDGPQAVPSEQRIAPSDRSSDSAQSPDITGLVDHVSRIMARQLAVERERRGL